MIEKSRVAVQGGPRRAPAKGTGIMAESLLGTKIGHVRFVDKIATGGMGEVYAGYDETLERKVALKGIRQEFHLSEEAKGRFLREARVLSQLGHPNICQIYDYIEGDKSDFIVMELVEGKSLARAMKKGLEPHARMRIAEQVAGVLVAAHEKGVVHRDLKPDNVMITEDGQVKVLDFGLSRQLGDEATLGLEEVHVLDGGVAKGKTQESDGTRGLAGGAGSELVSSQSGNLTAVGAIMGTVGYMSPEQARGEAATAASDMYSFGLLLQEIFTGKPPIEPNLDLMARLEKARTGETLPVSGVDSDLEALINRLKSVAQGARPSAADTVARLAWIREKPHRRRRKFLMSAAVAALVIFSATMTVQSIRATRAEMRAKDEAETARRVSEFLTSIFKVSDPSESRGNTVTAREILDSGAKKIGAELSGQPLVQSRLLNTMGTVYMGLGLYKDAEPLLSSALAIREKNLRPGNVELADSLTSLAELYRNEGKYAEAEPLYKRALALRENTLGPDHPDVAANINGLAVLYVDQGKYTEAEALYKRALAIREKALGPSNPDVAESLNDLASLYEDEGKYAEAEPLYGRSLTIVENALGPDHLNVATNLMDLANLHNQAGELAEAEPLYKRALAILERTLGPNHPDVAITLNNLAFLYLTQGKYAEAGPLFNRALAIWEKALGPDHPNVASSLMGLANLYCDQGKYADAEPLFNRALAIKEKALGPDHPSVAKCLIQRASLYVNQGKFAEAEPAFNRAMAIREKSFGPRSPEAAEAFGYLGWCELKEKRLNEAFDHSARCLEIGRELAAKAPNDEKAAFLIGWALLMKGQIEDAMGKVAEAQSSWKEAFSTLEPVAKNAERVDDRDTYAQVLLSLGRTEEARPIVRRLLECGYKSPDLSALCREKGL